MSTATQPMRTLGDVLARLSFIPADRIRTIPAPGTATSQDALAVRDREGIFCEVFDGILVEKPMGWYESRIAFVLGFYFEAYFEVNNVGFGLGADGPINVSPDQLRYPDIALFLWDRFPNRTPPPNPILDCVPDLAVEVISGSNTPGEMERKRREYFAGGAQLVWEFEPHERLARVYTAVDQFAELRDGDSLDGGTVLPGFKLVLTTLFDRAQRGIDSAP